MNPLLPGKADSALYIADIILYYISTYMQHKSMLHKTYVPHSFPIKLFHTSLNEDDEKHSFSPTFKQWNQNQAVL